MNPVLHSSEVHTWMTPESFLDLVRAVGPIALDPCTTPENPTGAAHFCCQVVVQDDNGRPVIAPYSDGLQRRWSDFRGLVYCNPPYGRALGAWAAKCSEEARLGAEIILLVPARPDTKWFQHLWNADALLFWRGRLKFKGATAGAPFPSAVAFWGPSSSRFQFCKVFGEHGQLV
jgi:hypothetical protein